MVCRLAPRRAGRAPQASLHSRTAEAALGVGEVGAPVAIDESGSALGTGSPGLGGAGAGGSIPIVSEDGGVPAAVLVEQAPTVSAKPSPPATCSNWRRLTVSERPDGCAGAACSMSVTIRRYPSTAASRPTSRSGRPPKEGRDRRSSDKVPLTEIGREHVIHIDVEIADQGAGVGPADDHPLIQHRRRLALTMRPRNRLPGPPMAWCG